MSNVLLSFLIAVLALPVTNFAQTALSPMPPGSAFYSYQHPDYPPFPVNLFPDLAVYQVERRSMWSTTGVSITALA